MAISEKVFQQQVIDLARLCGWLVYHTFDSRGSQPGFPDLILARPPLLVAAELKVAGRKPRPSQARWLEMFRAAGNRVFAWTPDDWDEIQRVLTRREGL